MARLPAQLQIGVERIRFTGGLVPLVWARPSHVMHGAEKPLAAGGLPPFIFVVWARCGWRFQCQVNTVESKRS